MINRGVFDRSSEAARSSTGREDWMTRMCSPMSRGEQTAYLVPDFEDDEEEQAMLDKVYIQVFENELYGWHTDESVWPATRDLETFREWFSIELPLRR